MDDVNSSRAFVWCIMNWTARKIHPGHKSVVSKIQSQLKHYMFQLQEQGVRLTNEMVMSETARLLPALKKKSTGVKELAVHYFTKSLGVIHCIVIHAV